MQIEKLTRQGIRKLFKISIFSFVCLIVISYALFASHDFILGPSIIITSPQNGSTLNTPRVTIVGMVKRIRDISLNDRHITIDQDGNFKEIEMLAPGYNILTLKVQDKFGRRREYRLELIYKVK